MNKMIWTEGLLLGQQHFQYWDKYWSNVLATQCPVTAENEAGVERAVFDLDALNRKSLRLIDFKIKLANTWLTTEDLGMLTLELPVSASVPELWVHLTQAKGQAITGLEGYPKPPPSLSHALAYYHELVDDYDSARVREVVLAKPEVVLQIQTPDSARAHGLTIAKLKLRPTGRYSFDHEFIPPVINICCSDRLMSLLQTLIYQIDTTCSLLKAHRIELLKDTHLDRVPDTHGPILVCLALYAQKLRSLLAGSAHPMMFYNTLLELIAACSTVIVDELLPDLVPYDHHGQTELWEAISDRMNLVLLQLKPSTLRQVKLVKESESFYVATGLESKCFTEMTLLLSVELINPNADWTRDFCRQVKIAARDDMPRVLASALPGLGIKALESTPMHLPYKPGKSYFAFDAYGECWKAMKSQNSLTVFLPVEFRDSKLELLLLSA